MKSKNKVAVFAVFITGLLSTVTASAADRVLRDTWYTMTVNRSVPYGYYNERLEIRGGRLFFQTHAWKQEEGYVNEEQLGAFAEDNTALTPLFYNFHSTYRTTETVIDGTMKDATTLTIKARRGGKPLPAATRGLPKRAIFSQFFPVWLHRALPELTKKKTATFLTVLEDDIDGGFHLESGQIRLEKPDALASSQKAVKVAVSYRGVKSFWWVEESGEALRIEMPAMFLVVEKVSKEKAQKFLSSRGK